MRLLSIAPVAAAKTPIRFFPPSLQKAQAATVQTVAALADSPEVDRDSRVEINKSYCLSY